MEIVVRQEQQNITAAIWAEEALEYSRPTRHFAAIIELDVSYAFTISNVPCESEKWRLRVFFAVLEGIAGVK